jgi:hypothetical protein
MADRDVVLHALRELIAALDRRVVHVERLGEARIASDASALRREAMNRIRELTTPFEREACRPEPSSGGGMMHEHEPARQGE